MGAQGSKARDQPGQSANPETQPQDYYDILQIDEDASQDEIKVGTPIPSTIQRLIRCFP